jgi:hypothetical protein
VDDPVKGKRELISLTAAAATLFLLISALAWLRGGDFETVKDLGRPFVVISLGILVLRRLNWPRIVLCVWFSLMTVVTGVAAISGIAISVSTGIMMILFALFWAYGALRLYTSPNIIAYMSGGTRRPIQPPGEQTSPPAV